MIQCPASCWGVCDFFLFYRFDRTWPSFIWKKLWSTQTKFSYNTWSVVSYLLSAGLFVGHRPNYYF